jgi:hypothetical protein
MERLPGTITAEVRSPGLKGGREMDLPSHIHGIKRILKKVPFRSEVMKDFISFKEFSIDHGSGESYKL